MDATVSILRKYRLGRKALVGLNAVGSMATGFALSHRRSPHTIDGHLMCLARRRGPSIAFVRSLLDGSYESETKLVLGEFIHPGMVVADIGAHVGFYTLLFARWVGPEGSVHAFEPDPENFELLAENIRLNHYPNIRAVCKAVSNRTGWVKLLASRQGSDRHSIALSPDDEVPRSAVGSVRLDDYMSEQGWPQLGLVKVDIEGAEPLALDGMREVIARLPELKIMVEFAPGALRASGHDPLAFLRQVRELGLGVHSIERAGTLRPWPEEQFPRFVSESTARGMVNLLCVREA